MAGFSLDFNEVYEGTGSIADGDYEVVVNSCGENATPSGAEYIEFDLIVRNDIDQPSKNQHVFHKVWKAKADGKYNMKTFNTIGKACQLQNGKSYKSFDDLLSDYVRKMAVVNIKNEESEYNGKTYTNTNVKYFNKTKFPNLNHTFKVAGNEANTNDSRFGNDPFANNGEPNVISDDDIPW